VKIQLGTVPRQGPLWQLGGVFRSIDFAEAGMLPTVESSNCSTPVIPVVLQLLATLAAASRRRMFQIVMPLQRTSGRETPATDIATKRAVSARHRLFSFCR
jgi:hypothetical protein